MRADGESESMFFGVPERPVRGDRFTCIPWKAVPVRQSGAATAQAAE